MSQTISIADQLDEISRRRKQRANWVPACGGSETPFTCKGRRLLYCWNGLGGNDCEHAYLDLDTDMILSEREESALGLR